jgi:hypothetical protein
VDASAEVIFCPSCGARLAKPGARFCHVCGDAVPQASVIQPAQRRARRLWIALIALALVLAAVLGAVLLLRPPAAGEVVPSPTVKAAVALVASSAPPQAPDTAAPATSAPPSVPATATPTPALPPTAPPLTPRLVVKLGPASGGRVVALDLEGDATDLDWPSSVEAVEWDGMTGSVYGRSGPYRGDSDFIQAIWVTRSGEKVLVPATQTGHDAVSVIDLATGERTSYPVEDPCDYVSVAVNPLGAQFLVECTVSGSTDLFVGDVTRGNLTQIGEDVQEPWTQPGINWSSISFADVRGDTTFLVTVRGDGTDRRRIEIATPGWRWPRVLTATGDSVFYASGNILYRQDMSGGDPQTVILEGDPTAGLIGLMPEFNQVLVEMGDSAAGEANDLIAVDATNLQKVSLASNVGKAGLEVSPDGMHRSLWVFTQDGYFRFVVDPQTATERVVSTTLNKLPEAAGVLFPISWLADGRLVYEARKEGEQVVLRVENADGSMGREFTLPPDIWPAFFRGDDRDGFIHAGGDDANGNRIAALIDLRDGRVGAEVREADGELLLAPGGRLVYRKGRELHMTDMDGNDRVIARDVEAVLGSNLH